MPIQQFKPTSIATKQVSSGAIADTAQLHGKVATADIYPGQQLTAADFVGKGGLTSELAPTQRAITISLDQAHGMVGQLQAGDHVDVYAGVNVEPRGGRSEPALRLLMTDIKVLQAGSSSRGALGGGGGSNSSDVTLAVSDTQTGALAYASDNGKVWLVLRPADASSSTSSPAITAQSLLLGGKPIAAGGSK